MSEEKDTSQVQEEKVEEVRPYRDPSLHRAKPKVTDSPPANSQVPKPYSHTGNNVIMLISNKAY